MTIFFSAAVGDAAGDVQEAPHVRASRVRRADAEPTTPMTAIASREAEPERQLLPCQPKMISERRPSNRYEIGL